MLVLSRRKDESVVVDGNIRIVVVDIRGDKVRLGIEAPDDVNVYRSEVLDRMRAENSTPIDGTDSRRLAGVLDAKPREVGASDGALQERQPVENGFNALELSRAKAKYCGKDGADDRNRLASETESAS